MELFEMCCALMESQRAMLEERSRRKHHEPGNFICKFCKKSYPMTVCYDNDEVCDFCMSDIIDERRIGNGE